MTVLQVGDMAPEISLPTDNDETAVLSGQTGQKVVVYFYPKDDTPGCTKEAIGFTEKTADFAAAGAIIWGISKDTLKKHSKFRAKYELGIPLLSDEEGDVCERYGTWVEKSMYGKTYMGIERATFLIDENGKIAQIWRKVKVPGHVDAVLDAVQSL
jgi:peroxiredoxin Q/BCP